MSRPSTPARVAREEMRVEVSAAFSRALDSHGISQTDIAIGTGADDAIVQRWGDRSKKEVPGIADVPGIARADRRVAMDLLTWAAAKIGARVVDAVDATASSLLAAVTASVRESGEAHAVTLEAVADGQLSDVELRRIADESREGASRLIALEQAALLELERRSPTRARA